MPDNIFPADHGEVLDLFGERFVLKVTEPERAVWEERMPPGFQTPIHRHDGTDETLVVVEGELRIRVGEEESIVRPGAVVTIPRGTPHGLRNDSDAEASIVVHTTPGNFVDFFRSVLALSGSEEGRAEIGRLYAQEHRSAVIGGW